MCNKLWFICDKDEQFQQFQQGALDVLFTGHINQLRLGDPRRSQASAKIQSLHQDLGLPWGLDVHS